MWTDRQTHEVIHNCSISLRHYKSLKQNRFVHHTLCHVCRLLLCNASRVLLTSHVLHVILLSSNSWPFSTSTECWGSTSNDIQPSKFNKLLFYLNWHMTHDAWRQLIMMIIMQTAVTQQVQHKWVKAIIVFKWAS